VTYFDAKNERQASARNINFDGASWFVSIQLMSRFYNRYAIKVRSIDVKYWISNSHCIDISKYEYTRY